MTKHGTFIIVDEMPEGGKFMDTCFERSGPSWCACNGCGAQGHVDGPWNMKDAEVQAKLEERGWRIFWMTRTDTPHCWQMATCDRCSARLTERLARYRSVGCESANLNDAA